jgi:hypothetical protein
MIPDISIKKQIGFQISPLMNPGDAVKRMLSDFISTNLDTKYKVLTIANAIERVMEYYQLVGKIIRYTYFIRIIDYSQDEFDFRVIGEYDTPMGNSSWYTFTYLELMGLE